MKSINKKITKKSMQRILPIVGITLFLMVGYFILAYVIKLWPFGSEAPIQSTQSPTTNIVTQDQQATDSQNKQNLIEKSADTDSTDTPTGSTSEDQSNITITTKQETNGTLTVSTKLYGYSSGTCTLKVTNGLQSSSQLADIIYQAEYSTCAGFSVPIDENGTGTWIINLTVTSSGQSTTEQISVEVE